MKKLFLVLSLLSISGLAMSQNGNTRRWVETDVSLSPYAKPVLFEGRALSAEVAVRYCFSDRFSAGLGLTPSMFVYDYQNGTFESIIAYMPFCVSLRYEFGEGKIISPYVIGNVAMSFLQLTDIAYQPRIGLGVSTWITPKTRLFAELSLAFFDDFSTLYTPLTIGFRF